MGNQDALLFLQEILEDLEKASRWLDRSLLKCRSLSFEKEISDEMADDLETLLSRFARLTDLLINKAFRAIDRMELEEPGSLIDVVNRAARRGIVDSVEAVRVLKELRNEIVHDYAGHRWRELTASILKHSPNLQSLIQRTIAYCHRFDFAGPVSQQ